LILSKNNIRAKKDQVFESMSCLYELIRETGGYSYDTYDVRVGPIYLYLSQKRDENPLAKYLLYSLYGLELFAPILYRKIRGIPKTWDPMGNSYRAGFQMTLYKIDGLQCRLDEAARMLDKVAASAVGKSGRRGFALGFPCITGSNKLWETTVPVAHYSLRVVRKFLIWEKIVGDGRYKQIMDEVISFLVDELPWIVRDGIQGVGYTPEDPLYVINIWADVASLLASYSVQYEIDIYKDKVLGLIDGVVSHQASDGSWPYFAFWEGKAGREDNSHTAMVLGALADVSLCYPREIGIRLLPVLEKGVHRWIEMFFDENTGRHWNTIDRKSECHTVCLGDALYAMNRLVRPRVGLSAVTVGRIELLSDKLVDWSIKNLQLKKGHFCERLLPYKKYCVKSIRSFDGLVCDSLSLYWAQKRLGKDTPLWTI
jgi:hypothetical protein